MKSMILLVSMMTLGALQARADGFICQTDDGSLDVKVYNQTHPTKGTRNAAIMIVSDPEVSEGRKTIATFESGISLYNSTRNMTATYVASVNSEIAGSSRSGENIAGTKLGQLKAIILKVDFSYSYPIEDGEEASAILRLFTNDGENISLNTTCVRYLKGAQ
jgi:hypothetical protein